jgi:hypothetical protein
MGSAREDKQTDERLCCLGEHLFAQLAGATAFDAIQFRVDPSSIPFGFCKLECDVIVALTHPRRRW